jgi:signal transduction histidine kinase
VTAERDPVWDRTPVLPTPGELRQRFASLTGIAIDAMRLGIQISASRRFDHPAQLPRITIAYPGIGIRPEVLPVPFDRADQARGLLSWKRISAGKFRRS